MFYPQHRPATSSFSFGTGTSAATTTPSFSFGMGAPTQQQQQQPQQPTGFQLGTSSAAAPALSFGTQQSGFSLGAPTVSFGAGASTTTTSAAPFGFGAGTSGIWFPKCYGVVVQLIASFHVCDRVWCGINCNCANFQWIDWQWNYHYNHLHTLNRLGRNNCHFIWRKFSWYMHMIVFLSCFTSLSLFKQLQVLREKQTQKPSVKWQFPQRLSSWLRISSNLQFINGTCWKS